MTESDSAERAGVLARALAAGQPCFGEPPDGRPAMARFLEAYYRHAPLDELAERSPEAIYGAALTHRRLAGRRVEGEVKIRVFSPDPVVERWESPHTVIQIVTDDMPFLVDSISAEIVRHDLDLHLVVHPQLIVRREILGQLADVLAEVEQDLPPAGSMVESWMHLEVDRQLRHGDEVELANHLLRVLTDVREAVEDWPRMRERAGDLADELSAQLESGRLPAAAKIAADDVREAADLLRWLADDHFTFLGYREYQITENEDGETCLVAAPGTGLGILRNDQISRHVLGKMPPEVRKRALEPQLLIVTKANSRSTVHRRVYLDYIGIKRIDEAGRVLGERRFLGLFTSSAYLDSVRNLPVIRRKVDQVLHRSGLSPRSHTGRDLMSVLETYPRDELFQIHTDQLYETVMGVLQLQDRRRLRLFMRRDDYERFWSCLIYLPRDRWNTQVRLRIQQILLEELHGTAVEYTTRVSESVLARLHFIVRTPPGDPTPVNREAIERRLIAATRNWAEDFADALVAQVGESHVSTVARKYAGAFPEAYKEDFPADVAVQDLRRLEMLEEPDDIGMSLYSPPRCDPEEGRFKIYRVGAPLSLADVLPLFQSHGVRLVDERPYHLDRGDGTRAWIYDFGLEQVSERVAVERVRESFQNSFAAAWRGEAEVDGFNALVLRAGLTWQQTTLLRAYAKYLRQAGSRYSQDYIVQAVTTHVDITRRLVELFETRFDPAIDGNRDVLQKELIVEIIYALDEVASLDHDRILRGLLGLIQATLRTSYYQRGPDGRPKPYLALKLDPGGIADLPAPRPRYEIFVYAPRVEGVHLRFGPVARGGLRWSNRREDYRTEVLGLVKAQTVKNTVIVPAGAKGGFFVKRPPPGDDRDALHAEAVICYRMFISALLDVTDNIRSGQIVPPPNVVRHDGDDPYLVVAADKGTATFSDLANEVAAEHRFWLGDAFASGGSYGYDHKRMGITARGAWESVRHHFRQLGVDTQTEDFTVVGIGDMSGDVFGNGMLLSEHIRLVAAFDHRHVFVDPDPDAARSYAERRRLFALPRSSWDDYDRSLISEGGGVWPRAAKSIPLSPQVKAALDIDDPGVDALLPTDLIRRVLTAPVDLLWNGGIGTYVKASDETHAEVGDKSNDLLRVNGRELRCRVVGEGGNLGLTQRGRIEYALAGGRVNTDAIDNSAGVDTSDREVNIKILLDAMVTDHRLTRADRNNLLDAMTDEVADLVLRNNYGQNLALGVAVAQATSMLPVHRRLMGQLEQKGRFDRRLEFLPDEEQLDQRASAGIGLSSPELAMLLAHVKIGLKDEVAASNLPDEGWFIGWLGGYFPSAVRERFSDAMPRHRLRRDIVTTELVNDMVNRGGLSYVYRAVEETGASTVDVVRAYVVGRDVFGLPDYWQAVEALDNQVPIGVQTRMYLESRRLLDRATRWLLQNCKLPLDIGAEVTHFRRDVAALTPQVPDMLVAGESERLRLSAGRLIGDGVPERLALWTAALLDVFSLLDIVEVAAARGRPAIECAELYFTLSEHFRVDRLLHAISRLPRGDRWHALARSALRYDLYAALAELTGEVLDGTPPGRPTTRIAQWEQANQSSLQRTRNSLAELPADVDLATLSVVLRQIRTMVRSSASPARAAH